MSRVYFAILLTSALAVQARSHIDLERRFELLFNGRDLAGWEEAEGFRAEDGTILSRGAGAGDLFTQAEYGNYILRFDYMLSEVGNSGVLVRADPEDAWQSGFEVQLLAPWTPYRDDLHCTGSLYGYVAVTNRPDESTNIWHSMEIVCDRQTVIVSVDGETVTWAQTDRVGSLKRKNMKGRIGFQGNHSNPEQWVRFRRLRLRNLDKEPDYVIRGFILTDPRIRKKAHEAALAIGMPIVPGLCRLMAAPDSVGPSAAREALFAIAARASSPGFFRTRRDSILKIIAGQIETTDSAEVKEYLRWLGGMLQAEE